MRWEELPKRELHCHVDGSVSIALLSKLAGRAVARDEVMVPEECGSLSEYLKCFVLANEHMQSPEEIQSITCDVIRQAALDHIDYMEPRFSPMLSEREGLTKDMAVEAVLRGLAEGERLYGVRSQLILCGLRHLTPEENIRMLDTAEKYLGKGVCAVDLAGDETTHPNMEFKEYLEEIKRRGIPLVIHSGETGNVENVRTAIEYGAVRIGHGIALIKDPDLMQEAARKHVGIEMCPRSNLQTKAAESLKNYPLPAFVEAGIPVSIHTDNRTVTDTTLTAELELIYDFYRDEGLMETLIQNAVETSLDR